MYAVRSHKSLPNSVGTFSAFPQFLLIMMILLYRLHGSHLRFVATRIMSPQVITPPLPL